MGCGCCSDDLLEVVGDLFDSKDDLEAMFQKIDSLEIGKELKERTYKSEGKKLMNVLTKIYNKHVKVLKDSAIFLMKKLKGSLI